MTVEHGGGDDGDGGDGWIMVVVLMVVLWAERNLGVVVVAVVGELTRRTNDRIIFEERPLVVIAINGG